MSLSSRTQGGALQGKIPMEDAPRVDHVITLERPLPAGAVHTDHLIRRFVDRKSRSHGFRYNLVHIPHPVTGEPNAMLHSIELFGAPHFSVTEIETAASWAGKLGEGAAERIAKLELDTSWMEKVAITSCIGCPQYKAKEGGLPAGCVSISWLWGGKRRDADYVLRYKLHRKSEETRQMEQGTDAHEMLFISRRPVTHIEELVERLARGERVAWAIPVCTPYHGLRARTPDIVISKMVKADDGYLLVHYAIEDKKHAVPGYWLQAWAGGVILTDPKTKVHNEMPDDTHIVNVEKFYLMESLRKRLGIDETVPMRVKVYVGLNEYGDDEKNPADKFAWVLRGEGVGAVNPHDLWSEDHVTLARSTKENFAAPSQLLYAVLGARKERIAAFTRGIIERVRSSQMQFTTSGRDDLDKKTVLDEESGVSMFRPKAQRR